MEGKKLKIAAIVGAALLVVVAVGAAIFAGSQIISAQAQSASQNLLGLTLNPVAQAQTQTPGTSNEQGLVVVIVNANGPAAAAGVKRGDILLSIDGKAVNSYADLKNALSGVKAGDTVTLSVTHGDTPETLSLTLGNNNGNPDLGLVPFGGNGRFKLGGGVKQAGAYVTSVDANSPAATAGIKQGDVILSVDGTNIDATNTLASLIGAHKSGDKVTLSVSSGGATKSVDVTLGDQNGKVYLGVQYREEGFGRGFKMEAGAYVTSVDANGPAATAGIKQGDVILSVDGTNIDATNTLASLIGAHKSGDKVTLSVSSGGTTKSVDVTLGDKSGKAYLGVQYQEEGFGRGFGGGPSFNGHGFSLPNGVTVAIGIANVVSGAPADKAGIKAGDVITKLNGTAVTTADAFVQAIGAMKVGDTATLTVYHQGSQTSTDIQVTLGDNPQSAGKPYLGVNLFGIDTTQTPSNGTNGNGSGNFQFPFRGRPFQTQPSAPSGSGA